MYVLNIYFSLKSYLYLLMLSIVVNVSLNNISFSFNYYCIKSKTRMQP